MKCACRGTRRRFKYHTRKWCGAGDAALREHREDLAERRVIKEAMAQANTDAALGIDTDTDLHKACVSLHRVRERNERAANDR